MPLASRIERPKRRPLKSLKSIGLDEPLQNSQGEYYLQLPFVGVFSQLDKELFAEWENDGAPGVSAGASDGASGVAAGASDRENNGRVWVYEGLPHSAEDLCQTESCLEILGFLFTISPEAVVMQSYGKNANCLGYPTPYIVAWHCCFPAMGSSAYS